MPNILMQAIKISVYQKFQTISPNRARASSTENLQKMIKWNSGWKAIQFLMKFLEIREVWDLFNRFLAIIKFYNVDRTRR